MSQQVFFSVKNDLRCKTLIILTNAAVISVLVYNSLITAFTFLSALQGLFTTFGPTADCEVKLKRF